VLTAGHVITVNETGPAYPASDVSYGMGASTTPFTVAPDSISQVDVDPSYTGDLSQGVDLALIQLSTPITNVTPAVFYTSSLGSELGLTATVVGYGETGTGSTGAETNTAGTRRALQNDIAAFGGSGETIAARSSSRHTTDYSLSDESSNLLFMAFDSPPTPYAEEGGTAPGDSGGGLFVDVNGQNYLTAIVDFDLSSSNGKYGDVDGLTRLDVPSSVSFLDSELIANSSWNLAGGGTWASPNDWNATNIPEYATATANFGGAIQTNSTVTLDAAWTAGTVTFNNTNSYTIAAGNGGSITLDNGGASATAALTDSGGTHYVTAPIALNSNLLATIVNPGDSLTLSGPISGGTNLTVAGSGTLRFGQGVGTPTFASVTVNTGATLDITTNAVAINYGSPGNSPIAQIVTALTSGYDGGTWTGTGITSSAAAAGSLPRMAVGYADGNMDLGTAARPNQVLIMYTLAGDANLDGTVNFADFALVLKNFGQTGNDWSQGNFTYDPTGLVGFDDFALVLANFLQSVPAAENEDISPISTLGIQPLSASVSVVPEPSAAAPLMAAAAAMAVGRNNRRRRRFA